MNEIQRQEVGAQIKPHCRRGGERHCHLLPRKSNLSAGGIKKDMLSGSLSSCIHASGGFRCRIDPKSSTPKLSRPLHATSKMSITLEWLGLASLTGICDVPSWRNRPSIPRPATPFCINGSRKGFNEGAIKGSMRCSSVNHSSDPQWRCFAMFPASCHCSFLQCYTIQSGQNAAWRSTYIYIHVHVHIYIYIYTVQYPATNDLAQG